MTMLSFHINPASLVSNPLRSCSTHAPCTAYDVLSDGEKRKIYDRFGEEGLKQHSQGRGGHDPGDIFSQCVV